ncbi:MAG: phage tail assembly protein [Alphaproteobacteria bacterium]|nr:phage tail assembly protein [Alphaproteobacteria bacterium]
MQTGPRTFPFTLPEGFRAPDGVVHREGTMRMATAYDEIAPLRDPRVQRNPGYLVVILLSRVVTSLGGLDTINPSVIEGLYACDFSYLQDLYHRINRTGTAHMQVACPHCGGDFQVEPPPPGGA